jgi:hypothetical protein
MFVPRHSAISTSLLSMQQPTSWSEYHSQWEKMWEAGISKGEKFDVHSPSPALVKFLDDYDHAQIKTKKALVPGCGRGYDVQLFASRGIDTIGLDLAPSGVEAAKSDFELFLSSLPAGAEVANARFEVADFFLYNGGKFDIIYDYTFLCALAPEMRVDWAKKMKSLLETGGQLITIIFPIHAEEKKGGPPWSMSMDLLKSLLVPIGFKATQLEILPPELCHKGRDGSTKETPSSAVGIWVMDDNTS